MAAVQTGEATEVVKIGGADVVFTYPNSGNAQTHMRNILQGNDYAPLGKFWNFSPTAIIDIGANVGATAFCFRQRYPNATIHCFEPASENIRFLERNVRFLENVKVYPFGLFGDNLNTQLFHGNVQCLQHSIFESPEVNSKDSETVRLRDAFDVLSDKLTGRCILKIDTEGCEVPILSRIRPLLANADIIYVEYHHEQQRRKIDELLAGYSVLSSNAKFLHRGNVMYGSERLVAEHPQLDAWGLTLPPGY